MTDGRPALRNTPSLRHVIRVVPPHAWLSLTLFGFAIGLVILFSLTPSGAVVSAERAAHFSNYARLLSEPYRSALIDTAVLGIVVTLIATFTSLLMAWCIRFSVAERWQALSLLVLALPLLGSHYLRVTSLRLLTVILMRIIDPDVTGAGYSRLGMILGLLSWILPVGTLVTFAGLRKVHKTTIMAARNHGATWPMVVLNLVVPLMSLELILTSIVSFGFVLTDSYCNEVLNGNRDYLVSGVLADRMRISDWPTVSALVVLAVLFELSLLGVSAASLRLARRVGG